MNATRINNESSGILIDQLVANELCETKRDELIQWLEGSRERWRDLGLAFLEAQAWSSSFADLAAPKPNPTTLPLEKSVRDSTSLNRLGVGFILAASLLFTFLGGVKWAQLTSVTHSDNRELAQATAKVQTLLSADENITRLQHAESIKSPSVSSDRSPSRSSVSSEKIKRSLEDRGFAVKTEKRFLPAILSDGRQVMLPFDQMTASYVGKTVF